MMLGNNVSATSCNRRAFCSILTSCRRILPVAASRLGTCHQQPLVTEKMEKLTIAIIVASSVRE